MENVLTAESLPLYLAPSTNEGTKMTAVYDYECAQADRYAERQSRKDRGNAAHKAQSAAWLVLSLAVLVSLVLGFVL